MAKSTTPKPDFTQKPDGTLTFELTIPKDSVQSAYQDTLREYAARVTLPGFRKGKAPLPLVEKQLDHAELLSHSLEHAFPAVYTKFIQDNSLTPLTDPRVTPLKMEEGADWVLKIETATFPTVKLGTYQSKIKAIKSFKDEKNKLPEIFDALLDNIKFDVSEVLVEAETRSALNRLAKQLSSLKLTVEDYAKSIKKSVEDLVKDYQSTATNNLRLEFILYEIGKSEGFKPEERQKTLDFLLKL